MAEVVGSVSRLWHYPVKSMAGEEVEESVVTERGLSGDRAFAVVDRETGEIASAKQPRKWARLLDCKASIGADGDGPAVITLPDGRRLSSDDPGLSSALSELLGCAVSLEKSAAPGATYEASWPDIEGVYQQGSETHERVSVAAPPGTFFDVSSIHLLTTASLARLGQEHPGSDDLRRFRPNLLLDTQESDGYVENAWAGRTLSVGAAVRLRVILPTPRCVMTTLAQGELPIDVGVLRAIARSNLVEVGTPGRAMACLGVYAVVAQGGVVRRGDTVTLE